MLLTLCFYIDYDISSLFSTRYIIPAAAEEEKEKEKEKPPILVDLTLLGLDAEEELCEEKWIEKGNILVLSFL